MNSPYNLQKWADMPVGQFVNVRFGALNELKSDIAPRPLSANNRH